MMGFIAASFGGRCAFSRSRSPESKSSARPAVAGHRGVSRVSRALTVREYMVSRRRLLRDWGAIARPDCEFQASESRSASPHNDISLLQFATFEGNMARRGARPAARGVE